MSLPLRVMIPSRSRIRLLVSSYSVVRQRSTGNTATTWQRDGGHASAARSTAAALPPGMSTRPPAARRPPGVQHYRPDQRLPVRVQDCDDRSLSASQVPVPDIIGPDIVSRPTAKTASRQAGPADVDDVAGGDREDARARATSRRPSGSMSAAIPVTTPAAGQLHADCPGRASPHSDGTASSRPIRCGSGSGLRVLYHCPKARRISMRQHVPLRPAPPRPAATSAAARPGRPAARLVGGDVEADADDHRVPLGRCSARIPASLRPPTSTSFGHLRRASSAGHGPHGGGDRDPGEQRQPAAPRRRAPLGPQQDRERQRRAGHARPGPAQPAAAGGLLLGDEHLPRRDARPRPPAPAGRRWSSRSPARLRAAATCHGTLAGSSPLPFCGPPCLVAPSRVRVPGPATASRRSRCASGGSPCPCSPP